MGRERALDGILTGQGEESLIDMTYAGKVGFSLVMSRRDGVLIGHGQERWCTYIGMRDGVLTVYVQ